MISEYYYRKRLSRWRREKIPVSRRQYRKLDYECDLCYSVIKNSVLPGKRIWRGRLREKGV